MKITVEYDLPDEEEHYKRAEQGFRLHSAIHDYDQYLRNICKHGDPKTMDAESCREKLWECLREYELGLD